MTMSLVLISFVLAMIIGALFGIMSVSQNRLMKGAAGLYVDLIRGVPLMVLAFFIFLGIPNVTGLSISDYTAGIITLTLNASAYIAEIFRGGIQAVPIGQTEASRSLGFNYSKTMRKIILPQAIKIMILL
jgi:polar amino acid transport system substrate-binding protein